MTHDQLRQKKMHPKCKIYDKFGHWDDSHINYGTLKPDTVSTNEPPYESSNSNQSQQKNIYSNTHNVLHFGVTVLSISQTNSSSSTVEYKHFGPVVVGGDPYSAIGTTEIFDLRSFLDLTRLQSFEPFLWYMSNYLYFK